MTETDRARSGSLPAQVANTRRFTLGDPDAFTIASGGATVLFLRSRAGDDAKNLLWAVDLDSAGERVLAEDVDRYATDAAGTLAACVINGGLWTVDVATGEPRRLPTEGKASDPRPDPTGRRIVYLADDGLRLIDANGKDDRPIAEPDGPEVVFGVGEHTHASSTTGARGHWWAPDGSALLVARVDRSPVQRCYLTNPAEPVTPPKVIRYPAAGTANADVTLWLVGLDGRRTEASWDRHAFEYLVGAGWDAHGPYALVQSRDQRTVRFLAIDPTLGTTTVLAEQCDDCWVQLLPGLPARTDTGALVWHLDEAGTRRLTVAGAPVTPPGRQLRSVLGVAGDGVLFTASDEPTETHLWSYRPGNGVQRLTDEPGVHSGLRRDGTLVILSRGRDRPGTWVTIVRADRPTVRVASLVQRPVLAPHATDLVLGPRALRARLYHPSSYRPGDGQLPVLLDPYGGAARQQVTAELDWRALVAQWFAEQGFAVLAIDGAGTPGRGPDWEREVHGKLFGPAIDDQVAGLHEAARQHPELDLRRVGIRGWSFGGALAAAAILRRPDVFHASVAGAAVSDQRLYNTHWRERFLGHPDEFPQRYETESLVLAAPQLRRPLLLIHGMLDTNVLAANTIRLSSALLAARRDHEVLLLPDDDHHAIGGPGTEALLQHQADFLRRHL